ncbi:hypothetical protein QT972_11685 [Microcoleus sp. herbarium7]|uniref:hypothetical protein n=1 Tax=Microcoleus sp. herbarium7 TaxID=3055435 RepID=UPI002FD03479
MHLYKARSPTAPKDAIARQILPQQIYDIGQKPGFWQNLRRSLKSGKNPVSLGSIELLK